MFDYVVDKNIIKFHTPSCTADKVSFDVKLLTAFGLAERRPMQWKKSGASEITRARMKTASTCCSTRKLLCTVRHHKFNNFTNNKHIHTHYTPQASCKRSSINDVRSLLVFLTLVHRVRQCPLLDPSPLWTSTMLWSSVHHVALHHVTIQNLDLY